MAGWSFLETAMWCSTAADRTRRRAPGWRCCSSAEGSPGSVRWLADSKAGASADFRWNASPLSPLLKTRGRTCGQPRGRWYVCQGGVRVEAEEGGGALRHGDDIGRGSRWVFASNAVRHYEVEFLENA
jgi:hypothetical protein